MSQLKCLIGDLVAVAAAKGASLWTPEPESSSSSSGNGMPRAISTAPDTSASLWTLEPESSSLSSANGMPRDISTAPNTSAPSVYDDDDLILDHPISMHLNCALPEPALLLPPPLLPSQSLPSTSTSHVTPWEDSWMSSPEFLDGFEKFLETYESPGTVPALQPSSLPAHALTQNFTADVDVPEQPLEVIAPQNDTFFQVVTPQNDMSFQVVTPQNDTSFQVLTSRNDTPQTQQSSPTVDSMEAIPNDDPTTTIPPLRHTTSAEDTPIDTVPNLKVPSTGCSSGTPNTDPIPQTDHNTESLAASRGKRVRQISKRNDVANSIGSKNVGSKKRGGSGGSSAYRK
jgi:hypothetical protein